MPTGKMIAASVKRPYGLSMKLAEGIVADRFARLPEGRHGLIQCNHPCFVYGHLALYMPRVCEMLGRPELAEQIAVPATWADLFGMGRPCVDDAAGALYPPMPVVLDHFNRGYDAAMTAAAEASSDTFTRINPNERTRDVMPTVGSMVTFLLTGHTMFHLGQLSTWRRIEGLPSAM